MGTSKNSVPEGRMLSARHESGGKSGKNNNKSRRDDCEFVFFGGSQYDDLIAELIWIGFRD
jgi:hypothetical protein